MRVPVGNVVYRVKVHGAGTLRGATILDVTIQQGYGAHDLAFVRMEFSHPYTALRAEEWSPWPAGSPVSITWGRSPSDIREWYGYVNHHTGATLSDSGTGATQVTYVMIGTSRALNSDNTRTWRNVSPSYIARELATANRLRPIVHPAPKWVGTQVQAGESDFEFLNRMAERIGYRFWCSGSDLYFVDPNILVANPVMSVPTYLAQKTPGVIDTVVEFQVRQGENLPGSVAARRTAYGVDTKTGKVLRTSSGSGPYDLIETGAPALSYTEATRISSASQSLGQNWTTGSARVFGATVLHPGSLVEFGGNALPPKAEGTYLVLEATHTLNRSTVVPERQIFVTDLTIVRNDLFSPSFIGSEFIRNDFIPCALRKDKWEATSGVING